MSLYVGSSFLPACISSQTIHKIHLSDASPTLSLWEKIKDFFFNNHHDQAMDCLFKLCHPRPGISREEVEGLFFQLRELAAPGYQKNFVVESNNSLEKCYYRITNKKGDDILSVFHGTIRVNGPESSWDQTMCLPRTVINL